MLGNFKTLQWNDIYLGLYLWKCMYITWKLRFRYWKQAHLLRNKLLGRGWMSGSMHDLFNTTEPIFTMKKGLQVWHSFTGNIENNLNHCMGFTLTCVMKLMGKCFLLGCICWRVHSNCIVDLVCFFFLPLSIHSKLHTPFVLKQLCFQTQFWPNWKQF